MSKTEQFRDVGAVLNQDVIPRSVLGFARRHRRVAERGQRLQRADGERQVTKKRVIAGVQDHGLSLADCGAGERIQ